MDNVKRDPYAHLYTNSPERVAAREAALADKAARIALGGVEMLAADYAEGFIETLSNWFADMYWSGGFSGADHLLQAMVEDAFEDGYILTHVEDFDYEDYFYDAYLHDSDKSLS
jgi:hypothetical protein